MKFQIYECSGALEKVVREFVTKLVNMLHVGMMI